MRNIPLQALDADIIRCQDCNHKMVNLDKKDIYPGDLRVLKRLNIRVSNPETDDPICSHCEAEDSLVSKWYDSDYDNDSDLFNWSGMLSGRTGNNGFPNFNTWGFGGGSFSGGGASRKF